MDQDWRMAGAEQGSHVKNQEEHEIPGDPHWAKDMKSLMQSLLELFEHSR